ncbi:MAG: Gfo/Idh/MocA family oxidoreductase [Planctomycetia bacterium]|nr:Gfo/Idh/MocA family oxidoreductase [Planctomycetia bacterium]
MSHAKFTRRDVLKGAAGTLVAAPYFWTSARAVAQAANDKLTVAAIGVGGRGTDIGRQAAGLGNMVACADVHRTNAEKFAEPYGGKCEIHGDYRKILDRKDVDAITCGTPDHWHVKISIDAMRAGKDVYCEKPLTLTMEESKQIQDAVKATGKVFQVGTQQRSEHEDRFLKAVVIAQSGRLGDKLRALSSVGTATTGGPFPSEEPPKVLDWEFWLGQAPKVDFCPKRIGWDFRWWLEYSGGQVTDWGVHHTDIALWALSGDKTGIVEAEGKGEFPGLPADVNIFDFLNGKVKIPPAFNVAAAFNCNLKLPNGNTINLTSGENELLIEGEKGKIRVNRGGLTGRPVEEIEKNPADRQWLDEAVLKLYRGKPRRGHMANFFECVKTRELPISDVYTHANSVNACHMANIAMLLKRKVTFDPAKYQFVGDEQANALMSRTRRAPYLIG